MELRLQDTPIWLWQESVDFRLSIDGLSAYVLNHMEEEVTEGIYVFYNRRRDKLKVLVWHHNGFILLYKRLERGKFCLQTMKETCQLESHQLSWLLAGLDWQLLSAHESVRPSDFC